MKNLLLILLVVCGLYLVSCNPVEPQIVTHPGSLLLVKIIEKNNWIVTLSIIGIGAGFFAFMNGNKQSVAIMASCLVVLSTFIMLAKFAVWVAVLAMATSVLLLGYTIFIKGKAIKEIVIGVQNLKKDLTKVNDKTTANTILAANQSSETKTIVGTIKEKL